MEEINVSVPEISINPTGEFITSEKFSKSISFSIKHLTSNINNQQSKMCSGYFLQSSEITSSCNCSLSIGTTPTLSQTNPPAMFEISAIGMPHPVRTAPVHRNVTNPHPRGCPTIHLSKSKLIPVDTVSFPAIVPDWGRRILQCDSPLSIRLREKFRPPFRGPPGRR